MTDHTSVNQDDLAPHGDGEFEPHRPPKFVEGVYKPHYGDPSADYVLMSVSLISDCHPQGMYWAQTDEDGVIRRLDTNDHEPGRPITEGADMPVGRVYDGEVILSDLVDESNVPELPDSTRQKLD